jgi:hypothetical protein
VELANLANRDAERFCCPPTRELKSSPQCQEAEGGGLRLFSDLTCSQLHADVPHLQVIVHQECTKKTASPHSLELLDNEESLNTPNRPSTLIPLH